MRARPPMTVKAKLALNSLSAAEASRFGSKVSDGHYSISSDGESAGGVIGAIGLAVGADGADQGPGGRRFPAGELGEADECEVTL